MHIHAVFSVCSRCNWLSHLLAASPACCLTCSLLAASPACCLTCLLSHLHAIAPACFPTCMLSHLLAVSPACYLDCLLPHLLAVSPACCLACCLTCLLLLFWCLRASAFCCSAKARASIALSSSLCFSICNSLRRSCTGSPQTHHFRNQRRVAAAPTHITAVCILHLIRQG